MCVVWGSAWECRQRVQRGVRKAIRQSRSRPETGGLVLGELAENAVEGGMRADLIRLVWRRQLLVDVAASATIQRFERPVVEAT